MFKKIRVLIKQMTCEHIYNLVRYRWVDDFEGKFQYEWRVIKCTRCNHIKEEPTGIRKYR